MISITHFQPTGPACGRSAVAAARAGAAAELAVSHVTPDGGTVMADAHDVIDGHLIEKGAIERLTFLVVMSERTRGSLRSS
jgi:hypothetical protein